MPRNYKSLKEALETGRGDERPFNCPVHKDEHASASVSVSKGVWVCYACRATGKTQEGNHDLTYAPLMMDEEIPLLSQLAVSYTNAWTGCSPYWASRYGQEVARLFDTGIDPIDGSATVPIRDAIGTGVYGFLKRYTRGDGPKYLYPGRVPVSRLLFGHHLLPTPLTTLVLVEGASDVMSLARWQAPANCGAAAVYGAGLHVPQVELVKVLSPLQVVVAMDADDAGRKANTRSVMALMRSGVAASVHDWQEQNNVTDPGELEENPWTSLIRTAGKRA